MSENANNKCKVIITGAIKPGSEEKDELKEYSKRSLANGVANGGVVLNKFEILENIGQGAKTNVVFIVEFPSREIAINTFTNNEYRDIIQLREKVFDEVQILIVN